MKKSKVIFSLACLCVAGYSHTGEVTTSGEDLQLNLKGPIEIKTTDGTMSAKLGGRIQWDYNYAEANGDADEDAFDIRRARMYLSGHVNDWAYKINYNIGNGNGGTPEDVYIRYTGWGKGAQLTVGRQNEPFGLEVLTSSKDNSFLERSAFSEAYGPFRSDGIQISGADGDLTYAVGLFEDDETGSDGSAITGRVTYVPYQTDDSLVHVGAAYTDRSGGVNRYGLEAAYVQGPYHIQTEYMNGDTTGADSSGIYVQAGWVITGEVRPYSSGIFKRITPNERTGAWEVVLRYDEGQGDFGDVELGSTDASAYGIGVNYYINSIIRTGITYTKADDNDSDQDGSEFRARLQIAL